jgi:HupE / UreJ protein
VRLPPRCGHCGLAALCASLVALSVTTTVRAHEIGTTRVSVLFVQDARTYAIEIVTDASALAEKLDAAAGREPSAAVPPRLEALSSTADELFLRRVTISFDESEVRPEVAYSVAAAGDDLAGAIATIRLRGAIPDGARDLAWTYGWTFASYPLTIRRSAAEAPVTEWLEGGQSSAPFAWAAPARHPDRLGTARRYLALGFTQIVPGGLDHVLFVLSIYLLSGRARSVLWQVSAFTLAHSITLGLGLYGTVSVPPRIVEPLIALSIAYVAVENIFLSELRPWRLALVFAFGLLHGLGFAGALQELGLPQAELATALVAFNAGVEAGQLAVIGAAFVLVGGACAHRAWYRRRVVVPASAAIACTAIYWAVARVYL